MDRVSKERIEKSRQITSLKTMYFNRFLLIRYITAFLFFANLYWFSALLISKKIAVIIPGVNLLFMTVAALEQFTFFSAPSDNAKKTILAYKLTLIINVMLTGIMFSPLFSELYPFLINSIKSKVLMLGIIAIGIILCLICSKRLQEIKKQRDKQYKYAKQFEKTIKVKI